MYLVSDWHTTDLLGRSPIYTFFKRLVIAPQLAGIGRGFLNTVTGVDYRDIAVGTCGES